MGATLSFVGMDVATPLNCQVSVVLIRSDWVLNGDDFKLWISFQLVGTSNALQLLTIKI
jgi:hypothetical protein